MPSICGALRARLVGRVHCETDDPMTTARKNLLCIILFALGLAMALVAFLAGVKLNYLTFSVAMANVAWCVANYTRLFVTRSASPVDAAVFIVGATVLSPFAIDIVTFGNFEFYVGSVVAMDLMLLCNCPDRVTLILRNMVLVVMIVQTVEQTLRVGLYDLLPNEYTKPEAKGYVYLPGLLLMRVLVFYLDFTMTRFFAQSMMREKAQMELSISVAQSIALALTKFDLAQADSLIDQASSGEVNLPEDLHNAFVTLISNLKTYKPYLPQSCLPEECEGMSPAEVPFSSGDGEEVTSISVTMSQNSTVLSGTNQGRRTSHLHQQHSIMTRNVVLVAVNIVNFLNSFAGAAYFEPYLETILSTVRQSHGLTEHFVGDRVLASFNAAKSCYTAGPHAVGCAVALKTALHDTDTYPLTIAVTAGRASCGNLGCGGMMRYAVIGEVSSWVHTLERYLKFSEVPLGIDASVVNVTEGYHFRLFSRVRSARSSRATTVWIPTGTKSFKEEEWMYQLESAPNHWHGYNTVLEAVLRGVPLPDDWERLLGTYESCSEATELLKLAESYTSGAPKIAVVHDIGIAYEDVEPE
eukprot:Sspe_Gene.44613::Locus_21883_Transcript_1_1_Confidence_1.000_Length_1922::g.44613::m.44613